MHAIASTPRFGTTLVVDTHPMTQKEIATFTPEAKQGVEIAQRMLAVDGNNDTLTLFYADDMTGQREGKLPNYLGFQLNEKYPYETLPVVKLHRMTNPLKVVQTIFEAYWKLKDKR